MFNQILFMLAFYWWFIADITIFVVNDKNNLFIK